jgi:hypothetical protein
MRGFFASLRMTILKRAALKEIIHFLVYSVISKMVLSALIRGRFLSDLELLATLFARCGKSLILVIKQYFAVLQPVLLLDWG